jgi:hypothetical protein
MNLILNKIKKKTRIQDHNSYNIIINDFADDYKFISTCWWWQMGTGKKILVFCIIINMSIWYDGNISLQTTKPIIVSGQSFLLELFFSKTQLIRVILHWCVYWILTQIYIYIYIYIFCIVISNFLSESRSNPIVNFLYNNYVFRGNHE